MDIAWQENDIITIDLSPQKNNIWGDYARTLVFENGVLCDETDRIKNDEWRRGLQMEEYLHKILIDVATPDMTFEELYYFMNDLIVKKGLSDVEMFTFEPHIKILRLNLQAGCIHNSIYENIVFV